MPVKPKVEEAPAKANIEEVPAKAKCYYTLAAKGPEQRGLRGSLQAYSLRAYSLGAYSLGLPILDLLIHIPLLYIDWGPTV